MNRQNVTHSYMGENAHRNLGTRFFVRRIIKSEVNMVQFDSDRMQYIILRGH